MPRNINNINKHSEKWDLTCLTSSNANCCKKPLSAAQVRHPIHSLHFKSVVGMGKKVHDGHESVH